MSKNKIYDRVEFCEKILNLVERTHETNAFILYSETGVGKTSVCKKIENILNRDNNKHIIRAITPQENQNIQEGAYIKFIFKSIQQYYDNLYKQSKFKCKRKHKKYTFGTFLRKKKSLSLIIRSLSSNFDNLIASRDNILLFPIYGIKTLIDFILLMLGLKKNIKIDNLNDNNLFSNYIKYVLNHNNIILYIDNVQNFDRLSLDYFMDCLMETKEQNNFILLEFTLLEKYANFEEINKLEKEFEDASISISSLKLEYLDIKNVLKIAEDYCSDKDEIFEVAIKNNYVKRYRGNIKKVEHFASIYSQNISLESDPTFEKIINLPSRYQYILAVIIINNAVIKANILKFILQNSNNDFMIDFETDINKFCEQDEFIEQIGDEIKIKHSSTIDVWQENIQIFKKYELNAYRNCQKVYSKILNNNLFYTITKEECILLLFKLYSKYDISKISELLSQIDEIIYEFLSIDELCKYLRELIETINDSEEALDFLYKIVDICIKFQLYDMEGFCLKKIKTIIGDFFDEKYNLYYYIKLFQSEEYEDLLELITKNKKSNVSEVFSSYSLLFEIITNRALNNTEKVSCLVTQTENNLSFKNTIFYAYFLRLAEAYEKRNFAIPKVEKSVSLFQKANLPIQAAKSQVSLAFLYAITGKLNDAKRELIQSKQILQKNIENKYIFNINQACINLLSGDFSYKTWLLLDEAEKYTKIKFDRIAIIINKIVWCLENSNYIKGAYLENKGIELLQTESDKHIHAIFYYNCYLLNKALNNVEKQQRYYKLAYTNRKYCDTLKARLENRKRVEDDTTFLLSKSWHVCFVSYWYFDYLKDL